MNSAATRTLVCFAVKEEASYFRPLIGRAKVEVLLTGMGRRNAERAIRSALAFDRPGRVITAGFAGGLCPRLPAGTVVFDTDTETGLDVSLRAAGARFARFYCAEQVVTTSRQKRVLHETTGAEAVEMESQYIRNVCRENTIPSATVRVILDPADEDLVLDFNQLMTADQRIDGRKLAIVLLKSPFKIVSLLRFQRSSVTAARRLAEVLARILLL